MLPDANITFARDGRAEDSKGDDEGAKESGSDAAEARREKEPSLDAEEAAGLKETEAGTWLLELLLAG